MSPGDDEDAYIQHITYQISKRTQLTSMKTSCNKSLGRVLKTESTYVLHRKHVPNRI